MLRAGLCDRLSTRAPDARSTPVMLSHRPSALTLIGPLDRASLPLPERNARQTRRVDDSWRSRPASGHPHSQRSNLSTSELGAPKGQRLASCSNAGRRCGFTSEITCHRHLAAGIHRLPCDDRGRPNRHRVPTRSRSNDRDPFRTTAGRLFRGHLAHRADGTPDAALSPFATAPRGLQRRLDTAPAPDRGPISVRSARRLCRSSAVVDALRARSTRDSEPATGSLRSRCLEAETPRQ